MKVSYSLEGKTGLTEISTNCRPIGLNFGTQPFLSMLPALATSDTMMAMAMMATALMAVMAKLVYRYLRQFLVNWAKFWHTTFSKHAPWSGNVGHYDGYGCDGYGYDGCDGKIVLQISPPILGQLG